jgi:hypothetical protein
MLDINKLDKKFDEILSSFTEEKIQQWMDITDKIKPQPKLLVTVNKESIMKIDKDQAELLGLTDNEFNWKLIRERDGLVKQSKEVMWLEWNENGSFKDKFDLPSIGRSLLMSPFNQFFTWQTTTVTEIIEQRDDYIKFKTENSTYELWKIKND